MSRAVKVLQAARGREVVELATVKAQLGITDNAQDTRLNSLIRTVSDLFASEAGLDRPLWRQKYQEDFPGPGRVTARLSRFPIETLVSLAHDEEAVSGALIYGTSRDQLYLEDGFEDDRVRTGDYVAQATPERLALYRAVIYAGWLMPGEAKAWAATTPKILGDVVKATVYVFGDFFFECTVAGTTGGTQPTWPTAEGGTVVDGTVTWTARVAEELPSPLSEAGLAFAMSLYNLGLQAAPAGIEWEEVEGTRLRYFAPGQSSMIPFSVQSVLAAYA